MVSWGILSALKSLSDAATVAPPLMWAGFSRQLLWAPLGAAALIAAQTLAMHHPLWPMTAAAAVSLWFVLTLWRPGLWLLVVPASLPLLNFSPWTGWLIFDEFDLLVLATLAGGYVRLACETQPATAKMPAPLAPARTLQLLITLALLLGASSVISLIRGFADAGINAPTLFQGYGDPLNSVRVSKSSFSVLLLLPLLLRQLKVSAKASAHHLAHGMLLGIGVTAAAVLWERAAYPGLLDFSLPYRTTALFWEMHVGGAALDAYLALATPFVAWLLWSARSPGRWALAAVLTLLCGYVCLTTFSRGVYLAVGVPLVVLGLVVWVKWLDLQPAWRSWRKVASAVLLLALLAEVIGVVGGGTFMKARLAASEDDAGSRMDHWSRGLSLVQTPAEWLFGVGLGRLPASYARFVEGGEFSGSVQIVQAGSGLSAVKITGPRTMSQIGGLYALTQRVDIVPGVRYEVGLRVRALSAALLRLRVCELHLLYERRCQGATFDLRHQAANWQHLSFALDGPKLEPGAWYAPRMGVLHVSVLNAGGAVELTDIHLLAPGHPALLSNGNFAGGLAHWFPAARRYFLPWHIDNLYLETLIERGVFGVLTLVGVSGFALWSLWSRGSRESCPRPRPLANELASAYPITAFLAASLSGALLVGSVSSVMDVPRVAFLFFFFGFFSIAIGRGGEWQIPHRPQTGRVVGPAPPPPALQR